MIFWKLTTKLKIAQKFFVPIHNFTIAFVPLILNEKLNSKVFHSFCKLCLNIILNNSETILNWALSWWHWNSLKTQVTFLCSLLVLTWCFNREQIHSFYILFGVRIYNWIQPYKYIHIYTCMFHFKSGTQL